MNTTTAQLFWWVALPAAAPRRTRTNPAPAAASGGRSVSPTKPRLPAGTPQRAAAVREGIRTLHPGYFALVMATVFAAARMLLYPFGPEELTPPYWVAMGATAITVVAGARIAQMGDAPMVDATRGLIAGASVVFWAFGSWLIPPLVAAGVWRHVIHRVPLRYEPTLWSIVFPLGMYSVAGSHLGQADQLPIVRHIGDAESWIALAAWAATFAAMVGHLAGAGSARRRPPDSPSAR